MSDITTRQSPELKVKLCECGCGQPAPLAKKTDRRLGRIKGQPLNYVRNHSAANPFILPSGTLAELGLREILLTQGKFAVVDAADFDWLSQWKWHVEADLCTCYAVRNVRIGNGKFIQVRMHRLIVGADASTLVDHKDGNGLNNTRANLRFASAHQNSYNRIKLPSGTSGYKGVTWHKQAQRWQAQIKAQGKTYYLGLFLTSEAAAVAYDEAAFFYHGEFARLNFARQP